MSADPTPEELAAQLRERTADLASVRAERDRLQADLDARTRKLDALRQAVLRHRDAVNDDRPDVYEYARKMWALAATPAAPPAPSPAP